MPKAKKRGRPPLPKGHVKGRYVPVRLSDEDFKAFTKAAKASEQQNSVRLDTSHAQESNANLSVVIMLCQSVKLWISN